jgi:hypothetical protein
MQPSFHAVILCALAAVSTGFGQSPPAPSSRIAGETVNVEVKIVPFYAVDAQGRPVYDLRPEEVELRVGGAPMALDSFDSYAIVGGKAAAQASPLASTPSRSVFFLFDLSFSSSTGLKTDKKLAARLVEGWPAGDRLFLMTQSTQGGLETKLGPVPPDAEGKKELIAAIEALSPEVKRLELQDDPTVDFSPPSQRVGRANIGAPGQQMGDAFDAIQATVRGEYTTTARGLADSLGGFAGDLRNVGGPKLLMVFSQGVDPRLYFDGDSGQYAHSVFSRRRGPALSERFREPLTALAESGTLAVFVNTDRDPELNGDAAVRHMASTTGGLYVEGRDPRSLETRVASATTAYYEAGFHPAERMLQNDRAAVEVVVRRPGVKAWSLSTVRLRESYRSLSAFGKRRLVIDLVAGGPEAQRAHASVPLKLQDLVGKVVGQVAAESPRLEFKADWPPGLATRKLDLYNVVLAPPAAGRKGKVLAFDQREETAGPTNRGALEAALTEKGAHVWGIVAVDPETEQVWMRRLMLQPPRKAAK